MGGSACAAALLALLYIAARGAAISGADLIAERRPHALVLLASLDEPNADWRIAFAWRRGGYLSHAASTWLALTEVALDTRQLEIK